MGVSDIGGRGQQPSHRHAGSQFSHLGYANPSTTNSWVAAVIADSTGYNGTADLDKPWDFRYGITTTAVYDMENGTMAWDQLGRREEFAIASVLWDLYDNSTTYGGAGDDDPV